MILIARSLPSLEASGQCQVRKLMRLLQVYLAAFGALVRYRARS